MNALGKAVPRCDSGDARGQRRLTLELNLGRESKERLARAAGAGRGSQGHGGLWRTAFAPLLSFIPVIFPRASPGSCEWFDRHSEASTGG